MTEKTDAERIAALEATIAKLEANNAELLKQKQNAARDRDEAAKRAEEAAQAAEAAAEEKARASNDLATLEATLTKKFQKQIDALTAERDGANSQLHQLVVENGITSALTAANVAPHYAEAAAALLKAKNKIEIADGAATIAGKPLADFVADWAKSDHGKVYVAAPVNAGGGSTGSTGATSIGWTKDNFESRMTEFMTIAKTDAAQAAQIAQAVGRPDLVK